eukprot:CAMPEP_0117011698 /NCGR_PEP_ID=MMETSP0472-20121206/10009_1 /TAXON_ID=693140 ORGANISM="Tiarina fusus, Strain LIS" /NCGR_SAMPLE_ID=MMETSP0472 /ASSEMBLY_ACC=CAM_ASM_000603 /LENGTH=307 /DNA_ID=CAMNT_0004714589 /DNA_START=95 /DNA_END=1018 /DNA_ORIENTATION=+
MAFVFLLDQYHAFTTKVNSILPSSSTTSLSSMGGAKIGFVGCGTIAASIARGIATQTDVPIEAISVSRRSKAKSQALADEFPTLVTVFDDNQEILNCSDVIFICVLPDQTASVLQGLSFDASRHSLVSLVSTAKIPDLISDSGLKAGNVSKMICLPSIARHEGVALHCCPTPDPFLTSLFDACGGVVTLQEESELQASMVTTCIMGPVYGIMRQNRDWVLKNTKLTKEEASKLVIKQYMGAVEQAQRLMEDPDSLDELIDEQTKGGLNEQALGNLDQLGGLAAQDKILDAVVSRIRGESDGSIQQKS